MISRVTIIIVWLNLYGAANFMEVVACFGRQRVLV